MNSQFHGQFWPLNLVIPLQCQEMFLVLTAERCYWHLVVKAKDPTKPSSLPRTAIHSKYPIVPGFTDLVWEAFILLRLSLGLWVTWYWFLRPILTTFLFPLSKFEISVLLLPQKDEVIVYIKVGQKACLSFPWYLMEKPQKLCLIYTSTSKLSDFVLHYAKWLDEWMNKNKNKGKIDT